MELSGPGGSQLFNVVLDSVPGLRGWMISEVRSRRREFVLSRHCGTHRPSTSVPLLPRRCDSFRWSRWRGKSEALLGGVLADEWRFPVTRIAPSAHVPRA